MEQFQKIEKLSEAMRKGAIKTSPTKFIFYNKGSACALGACHVANYGKQYTDDNIEEGISNLVTLYPELNRTNIVLDPTLTYGRAHYEDSLLCQIMTMNDSGRFTREEIAQKLEEKGL